MSNSEVNALSNQAEKLLDALTLDKINVTHPLSYEPIIGSARVLAELAKAQAMVELADAIRESTFGRNA